MDLNDLRENMRRVVRRKFSESINFFLNLFVQISISNEKPAVELLCTGSSTILALNEGYFSILNTLIHLPCSQHLRFSLRESRPPPQ